MTTSDPQLNVVVVDDDMLVRDGIAAILEGQAGINVIGRGADGRDAIRLCRELEPHVALLDIQMPKLDGLKALTEIRRTRPRTAVVMLTTFDSGSYIDQALRNGAAGFLLKNSSYEELVAAVRTAQAGHRALSPSVTDHVVAGYLSAQDNPDPADLERLTTLSAREREILDLVATGASNAEIARTLHLSEHTVKTHVSHVLAKTNCADRTQAAVLVHRVRRPT